MFQCNIYEVYEFLKKTLILSPPQALAKMVLEKIHIYGNRIVAYGLVHTHAKAHVNPSIINGDIRGGPNRPPPGCRTPKKGRWE